MNECIYNWFIQQCLQCYSAYNFIVKDMILMWRFILHNVTYSFLYDNLKIAGSVFLLRKKAIPGGGILLNVFMNVLREINIDGQ